MPAAEAVPMNLPAFRRQGRLYEIPAATASPDYAIVIGTFAAVPYIHLHLEARRRLYPHVPCLVHDDCSPVQERLLELCRQYGAIFAANTTRFPPTLGDLSALYDGLLWADEIGAGILVKFSRRFVPITDWRPSLMRLVQASDYHTYSSWTTSFNFGFRTEAMALAVEAWHKAGCVARIGEAIANWREVFVEGFVHNLARSIPLSAKAQAWDRRVGPRPADRNGYAPWDWLGTDRCTATVHWLWHDSHGADAYAELARFWGLPYQIADFLDPNMGHGTRP